MKTILKLLIPLIFLTSFAANASGFLIEPYGGYTVYGTTSEDVGPGTGLLSGISGTEKSTLQNNLAWGGRLGYEWDNFFISADYQSVNTRVKPDSNHNPLNNSPEDMVMNSFGGTAGVRFSDLRAWLGYFPYDIVSDNGLTDRGAYIGSAFKVGVGYSVLNYLSVNFEYTMHTYTTLDDGSNKNSLPYTIDDGSGDTLVIGKITFSSLALTLSFPFEI